MLRLAAPRDLELHPLTWGLDLEPWSARTDFVQVEDRRALLGMLAAREVDAALLPAHELAHVTQRFEIVPGLAVGTRGASGSMLLHHRRPLQELRRVSSACPGHAAEVLARLLFAAGGTSIEVVEAAGAPEAALEESDALLVAGDAALCLPRWSGETIDLGEAWSTLTRLPFTSSLWAAWPGAIDQRAYRMLHTARTRGRRDLDDAAARFAARRSADAHWVARVLGEGLRYRLGNAELDGLTRFWNEAADAGLVPAAGTPRLISFGGKSGFVPGTE